MRLLDEESKNRRNWKERKRWWGCIEITLRGVPREQVVRKPTRKYVPSKNRKSKKRKRTRKIFDGVTAKRWNKKEKKKKTLQLYECSGSEIKIRNSREKKRWEKACQKRMCDSRVRSCWLALPRTSDALWSVAKRKRRKEKYYFSRCACNFCFARNALLNIFACLVS